MINEHQLGIERLAPEVVERRGGKDATEATMTA